jgi:hypothetical protein
MAAITVELNSQRLVAVGTEGIDLIAVNIDGDRFGPDLAVLRVTGGTYPEGGESEYVIWQEDYPLSAGDRVSITFSDTGDTSKPAKTIDELYPDKEALPPSSYPSAKDMLAKLAQRPTLHEYLGFKVSRPDGTLVSGRTSAEEHGFGFSVLWNSRGTQRVRVGLHTYTLEGAANREGGIDHARFTLQRGETTVFVVPPNNTLQPTPASGRG